MHVIFQLEKANAGARYSDLALAHGPTEGSCNHQAFHRTANRQHLKARFGSECNHSMVTSESPQASAGHSPDLTESCRNVKNILKHLHKGQLKHWQSLTPCLNASMLLLRPACASIRPESSWWKQWSKSEEAELLLHVLKDTISSAPAAMQEATPEAAQVVAQVISGFLQVIAAVMSDEPKSPRWPHLQTWLMREQGMPRIIHVTLALLPLAAASSEPFAALDAAVDLSVSFSSINTHMSTGGMEALQRNSAELHGKFLRDTQSLLRCYNGSANVQCLVSEWCKDLDRLMSHSEPGPYPEWWQVLTLIVLLPIVLFMPMLLPHAMKTFMSGGL